MAERDFAKRMRNAPNEELLAVVSSPDGYVPAAVAAAQAEIARRNLGSEEVSRIAEQIEDDREFERTKPSTPLTRAGKIAFFVFGPFFMWSIAAAAVLAYRGYRRKSIEGVKWSFIGLVFWLTVGWGLFFLVL